MGTPSEQLASPKCATRRRPRLVFDSPPEGGDDGGESVLCYDHLKKSQILRTHNKKHIQYAECVYVYYIIIKH